MQLKIFIVVLVLLLTLTPTYVVPAATLAKFSGKLDNSIKNDRVSGNGSATGAYATNDSETKNWDFEKLDELSEYVYIENDSIELVLGVNGADSTISRLETVISKFYGKIVNNVWMKGALHSVVIGLPLQFVSSFVKEVQDSEIIRYIEPNVKYQIHSVPNDPFWNRQWGPVKIEADWAWNITTGKRDVLVAVVDTGIDWQHVDLAANYVPLGYDWVNNDTNPMDDNGHGTHVAGTIAAVLNNGIGIAGMAQVRVMAEKGLDSSGSGNEDDLANAIIHAVEQNASIISMSWGSNVDNNLIREAIKFAYDSGVLLVASAGNARNEFKSYPAAYDEVIAVSATDQTDRPAFFTNFGDWIELAAPGVQIYSTILNNEYGYKSGTSMACPHVSGLAALIESKFPNMTRDQVRYHLRYTADDLGAPGFDINYGYGRINARRAVNQSLPENDILMKSLAYPYYIELNSTGTLNATILNYGARDENNITVEFLANGTLISSYTISFLKSGFTSTINFTWTPLVEGLYPITIGILPISNETMIENNFIKVNIYGGTPIKAYVIRSSGTYFSWITATWEKLNKRWFEFGDKAVFVDFTALNKENITYDDLVGTGADVLIISSAYSSNLGFEFADSEIDAITRYVYAGHGLIVSSDTFSPNVPNNNKLARILGIDETISWSTNLTFNISILQPSHPIFRNVPNPLTMYPSKLTAVPSKGWTNDALVGLEYVALGTANQSAIVTYRGLVYSSVAIESYASQSDLQLSYNMIAWSHYERPQHDLIVGLEAPQFGLPHYSIQLNATVSNIGISNETNVDLLLIIDDNIVNNVTIPELTSNLTYTMNYLWIDPQKAIHNITVYALPVFNETNILNNKITRFATVSDPIIQPMEGQWANYKQQTFIENTSTTEMINFTYNHYISPYQITVTYLHSSLGDEWVTSSVVNTITRQVEKGALAGQWFHGWIETNVTLGSKVKVLNGLGTIVGSRKITVANRTIECWELFVSFRFANYTFYYDKISGLLSGLLTVYDLPIFLQVEWTLLSTNIPIGRLIQPKVGDYAVYEILYFNNSDVRAQGSISFSYMEFIDTRKVRIQINYFLYDNNYQLIENFTGPILVNIQTRIVEGGPPGWNGTYYFSWIETEINLGSSVNIWNQTGTVIGSAIYSVGQRIFDTWLVYLVNETQFSFYNYDKVSGLLIKSTETSLNNPTQNVTFTLLQTNVDITPPTISIQKPTNNAFINSTTIIVQWNASDNETGITHYILYLNSVQKAYLGSTSYPLTGLTDGTYVIKVEAYDLVGNVNSDEVTVVVDVTAPTVNIIAPSNGSYLKDAVDINLTGNDTWFDFMTLSINDVVKSIFLTKGDYTYSWNTSEYDDGTYNISLKAVDKAGNIAIQQITAVVDNTIPEVQITQIGDYVRGIVNVDVYANDANMLLVSFFVNDQLIDFWNSVSVHTTVWNSTEFLDGSSVLKVMAFDKAGNVNEQTIQVTVDNTPPEAKINSPINGTYVSGIVHINLTVTDANLENATLMLDGETLLDVTAISLYEWNTSQISDGQHILKLEATDKAGNYRTDTITVTVDNTKPIVNIFSPENNTVVAGNVTITFMHLDENLESAVLFLNETNFGVVTNITELTINTKILQDGTYHIRLTALDFAGNQNEAEITIVVDNSNPTATIDAPADGAQLLGIVNINFTASDAHLANILLYIDDAVFNVTSQTSFQWNTTNVGDGVHVIRIVAIDSAGNMGTSQITARTENVQKAAEDSYNAGRNLGILIGMFVSLVVVIAIALVIKCLPSLIPKIQKKKEM